MTSLPGREGHVGGTAADNRLFVDAVLYRYRREFPGVICRYVSATGRSCTSFERELGNRATFRLRQHVVGCGLDLERVACSCSAGTEGTSRRNRRPLVRRRLEIGKRDCGIAHGGARSSGRWTKSPGYALICNARRRLALLGELACLTSWVTFYCFLPGRIRHWHRASGCTLAALTAAISSKNLDGRDQALPGAGCPTRCSCRR